MIQGIARACCVLGHRVRYETSATLINYADLRRRVDMEEVLAWMNWQAQERKGESLQSRCPFCNAANPPTAMNSTNGRSFVVNTTRKLFKCFRCHEGGNVLDLWTRYRKTDLNTAANELLRLLIDQPKPKSSNSQSQPLSHKSSNHSASQTAKVAQFQIGNDKKQDKGAVLIHVQLATIRFIALFFNVMQVFKQGT